MTVLSESVQLKLHGDLVELCYASDVDNAGGAHKLNGTLWLERASLPWLRDALEKAIADDFAETSTVSIGGDNLRVLVGGHEAEPYVNVFNKRADSVERPGTYWFAPSRKLATTLVEKIKSIAP